MKEAGLTYLDLDDTVVRTDRVAAGSPNGADLWWSGKHRHHRGNVRVVSTPDGWPLWVSPVRPGREHDTPARHHGLIDAGGRPTEAQRTYNKVIRGVHGVLERADSLLKTTFKDLHRVSLDPSRITKTAAAALVLLQLEYGRTI